MIGKTFLIPRFTEGLFNEDTMSSLSVQFITKTIKIDDKPLIFDIWDTARIRKI